jgi:mycothiol synthase
MEPVKRPFRGEEDVEQLVDLLRAMIAADKGDLVLSRDDIQFEWIDEEAGWVRDLQVWEADGRLLAAIGCWHEIWAEAKTAYAEITMHPGWRCDDAVDRVLQSATAAVAGLVSWPVEFRFGASDTQEWLIAGAERNGFSLDRVYFRMVSHQDGPFTDVVLPDGFTIRPLAGDGEVEQWVAAFNEAFASHHDAPTYSAVEKRHRMQEPTYLPETDLVLVAPDGEFAGISLNTKEVLEGGEERAWVRSIGIRPYWRGTGLGRVLLQTSINALMDQGFRTIRLSVDSDNATSALRLYKGSGFEVEFRRLVFVTTVDPAIAGSVDS